jgi:hypothetical protein
MTLRSLIITLVVSVVVAVPLAACSSLADECKKATVTPDGDCSDDGLQCAYTIDVPLCDGTGATSPVDTSCVCQDGAWSCPAAADCPAP